MEMIRLEGKYAQLLGYEDAIGAMGYIGKAMSALCEVTVVLGKKEIIGKTFDVHKEDIMIDQDTTTTRYYMIADYDRSHVYLTQDREFFLAVNHMLVDALARIYEDADMDMIMRYYSGFTIHHLDKEASSFTKVFKDTYASQQEVIKNGELPIK